MTWKIKDFLPTKLKGPFWRTIRILMTELDSFLLTELTVVVILSESWWTISMRKELSLEKAIEIAKNMLRFGDPLEKIVLITGLTLQQVQNIQHSLQSPMWLKRKSYEEVFAKSARSQEIAAKSIKVANNLFRIWDFSLEGDCQLRRINIGSGLIFSKIACCLGITYSSLKNCYFSTFFCKASLIFYLWESPYSESRRNIERSGWSGAVTYFLNERNFCLKKNLPRNLITSE